MGIMAGEIENLGDNWIPLTQDHTRIKGEIDALRVVRENIRHLDAFWEQNIRFCPEKYDIYFKRRLGQFYGIYLKIPMAEELMFENEGREGVVPYINKDYFEHADDGDFRHHKSTVEDRLCKVWRAMSDIHAEVLEKWKMSADVKTEYNAVSQTAFASVRKWLKIPSFNEVVRREQIGDRSFQSLADMNEMLRELGSI
jgi:hypothetical protein